MRHRTAPASDLDLVPVMNLVAILIPFLLFSAQFVPLAAIENQLPVDGPSTVEPPGEPLALTITISEWGYRIDTGPWEEAERVTCVGGACRSPRAWSTDELRVILGELKEDWPEETQAVLRVEGGVPYEVVIATLDASRADGRGRELFPRAAIAGT